MPTVTVHTITRSGNLDSRSERVGRDYAEGIVESDTSMVHTVMFPDGTGTTTTYWRRSTSEPWVVYMKQRFSARPPAQEPGVAAALADIQRPQKFGAPDVMVPPISHLDR
jgi:hypothetical protein